MMVGGASCVAPQMQIMWPNQSVKAWALVEARDYSPLTSKIASVL